MSFLILSGGDLERPGFGANGCPQQAGPGVSAYHWTHFTENSALTIEAMAYFSFKFLDFAGRLGVHRDGLYWLARRNVRF